MKAFILGTLSIVFSFSIAVNSLADSMKVTPSGIQFPDNTSQTTSASSGSGLWSQNGFEIYYNSGNVGIGNANPSTQLDVSGTVNMNAFSINSILVTPSAAELNFVDGVTSDIQTQLNGKQASITGGASSITATNLTSDRALISDSSGKVRHRR